MDIIEDIARLVDDELNDTGKYAELAIKYRNSCALAAELFNTLSAEELRHKSLLHDTAVKIINEYKDTEDPKIRAMIDAYNLIHELMISKEKEARIEQAMFRG